MEAMLFGPRHSFYRPVRELLSHARRWKAQCADTAPSGVDCRCP